MPNTTPKHFNTQTPTTHSRCGQYAIQPRDADEFTVETRHPLGGLLATHSSPVRLRAPATLVDIALVVDFKMNSAAGVQAQFIMAIVRPLALHHDQ